jgi:beta-lactamase superfamily II metal-dependent hydrolase
MKYEIEMLDVGNADAILLRYFDEEDLEYVILIDAGRQEHGSKVVDHIMRYTEQQYIDLAICTHPDDDHIGGFFEVLDKIEIKEFWIHDPNLYRDKVRELRGLVEDQDDLEKGLKLVLETLDDSLSLIDIIDQKVKIRREPLTGLTFPNVPITVTGPTADYYLDRLGGFRQIGLLLEGDLTIEKARKAESLLTKFFAEGSGLGSGKDSSKENNSSAIILFHPGEKRYLFTSDADINGLNAACGTYDLEELDWMQIPHHGSIKNINSRLIEHFRPKVAYISAAGNQNKPHKSVVDAFKSAGAIVYSTINGPILRRYKMPLRPNYSRATPL